MGINQTEELRPYRRLGLTLLQMMLFLGTLGIVVTLALKYFVG